MSACKVFYHDKCFDGACSAALFTKFHRECVGSAGEFLYQGLVHRAGQWMEESWWLAEGENAIVDFKYSASPRLNWWFDHHLSAFASAADEAHFREGQGGPLGMRQFFDPGYTSCTGWIAHIASTKFGMNVGGLEELIHWADIVDGAKYESAKAAVEMEAAAMKLTLVIESAPAVGTESGDVRGGAEMQVSPQRSAPVEMTHPSPTLSISQRMIPLLTEMPLDAVLAQPFVQEQLGPLLEQHRANVELLQRRAVCEHGVIRFEITDHPMEGYNKFIPYYLHPEGTYHVGLSRSSFRNKVSVGTNPWTTRPASELVNIATICERFGGGGHARVGAISFALEAEGEARAAAAEIVAELSGQ